MNKARVGGVLLRALSGAAGLVCGLVAVVGPLLNISNDILEAESASQYGGRVSLWGVVGEWLTVLIFAACFGFAAYALIRFSLRRLKSSGFTTRIP